MNVPSYQGVSRRCRCGCVLWLSVPRRLDDNGVLHHDPPVIDRAPCEEHRRTPQFRAERVFQERGSPATLGTMDALVVAINKEVG